MFFERANGLLSTERSKGKLFKGLSQAITCVLIKDIACLISTGKESNFEALAGCSLWSSHS